MGSQRGAVPTKRACGARPTAVWFLGKLDKVRGSSVETGEVVHSRCVLVQVHMRGSPVNAHCRQSASEVTLPVRERPAFTTWRKRRKGPQKQHSVTAARVLGQGVAPCVRSVSGVLLKKWTQGGLQPSPCPDLLLSRARGCRGGSSGQRSSPGVSNLGMFPVRHGRFCLNRRPCCAIIN